MSSIKFMFFFLIIAFCASSCKTDYEKYVERELSSNVKNDSIIFGLYLGMPRYDYFERCWHLNHNKVVGSGNGTFVEYIDRDDEVQDKTKKKKLLFQGIFDDKKIMRGMEMRYSYFTWSPWLKNRQSDTLVADLLIHLMQKYKGNDFIEITLEEFNKKAYVKIDGNRQILMYPKTAAEVMVKVEDLPYKLSQR